MRGEGGRDAGPTHAQPQIFEAAVAVRDDRPNLRNSRRRRSPHRRIHIHHTGLLRRRSTPLNKNPTSTLRGLEGEKRKVQWTFRRPETKFAEQIRVGVNV